MSRRAFLGALGILAWITLANGTTAQDKVPRIGFLTFNVEGVQQEQGFKEGLRELGYMEGSTIIIEWRRAKQYREAIVPLTSELVRLQVDLIVAVGTLAAQVALETTSTIPIVFLSGAPMSAGLATNMARPDRNATGISILSTELHSKRLDYLHQLVPRARRIAYLMNSSNPLSARDFEAAREAARALGLQLVGLDAHDPDKLDAVLRTLPAKAANAVLIGGDGLLYSNMPKIAQAVRRARLPAIAPYADYRAGGVLMSYGPNTKEMGRRMAVYVDKLLRGSKPVELPIEEISTYQLVIDLRVARELRIQVPQELLYRADEVIR